MLLETVGKNIRAIRAFKQISRQKLADDSKLNPTTIWKIESGRGDTTLGNIDKIALALGVNVRILFADSINFSQQIQAEYAKETA